MEIKKHNSVYTKYYTKAIKSLKLAKAKSKIQKKKTNIKVILIFRSNDTSCKGDWWNRDRDWENDNVYSVKSMYENITFINVLLRSKR